MSGVVNVGGGESRGGECRTILLFQSPVFLSLKIFLLACLQYGLGSLQLLLKTKEIPDPHKKDGVISFTASSNLWNLQ